MLLNLLFLAATRPPLLMVHYMPWFQTKPPRAEWGWHWTMNVKHPETVVDGKPDIAAHVHPLIGPYDSDDEAVLDCQVQLMKLSGIDGALIDWYGNVDTDDYLPNHIAAAHFIKVAAHAGLKFGLVYEDRTVPNLIKHGKVTAATAVSAGNKLMHWVDKNWFSQPNHVRLNNKPVFLVFGPEYYKHEAWNGVFAGLTNPPSFFTLDSVQAPGAGTYGWPQPGTDWQTKLESYYHRAVSAPVQIAPAFPRFDDFYHDAGIGASYGQIPDDGGKTYTKTLGLALASGSPIIQLITWNDYGEGTVIEPTLEYGNRDLVATQKFRRSHVDSSFKFGGADLDLPIRLLKLRRAGKDPTKLHAVSELLFRGETVKARKMLEAVR